MLRVDPCEFFERPFQRNVGVHRKLKEALCKRKRSYLWTPEHKVTFVPALSSRLYGDGRALLGLTTINARPRYYILRVDSAWALNSDIHAPCGQAAFVDYIDAISFALEEEFGNGRYDNYCDPGEKPETERQRDRRRKWPAYDDETGCSWWRIDWPKLPSVKLEPHPFVRNITILQ